MIWDVIRCPFVQSGWREEAFVSTMAPGAGATRLSPARDVASLLDVLRRCSLLADSREDRDADPVSILQHGLQCAALLAHARPEDQELQVAGLIHDIGHVLVPGDIRNHGRHGGEHVRRLLGGRVADLVELHVPAKRFLVTIDHRYKESLSLASCRALVTQGGQLLPLEVEAFRAHPAHGDAVMLRRADEAAKVEGLHPGTLEEWHSVLEALAARHAVA